MEFKDVRNINELVGLKKGEEFEVLKKKFEDTMDNIFSLTNSYIEQLQPLVEVFKESQGMGGEELNSLLKTIIFKIKSAVS